MECKAICPNAMYKGQNPVQFSALIWVSVPLLGGSIWVYPHGAQPGSGVMKSVGGIIVVSTLRSMMWNMRGWSLHALFTPRVSHSGILSYIYGRMLSTARRASRSRASLLNTRSMSSRRKLTKFPGADIAWWVGRIRDKRSSFWNMWTLDKCE